MRRADVWRAGLVILGATLFFARPSANVIERFYSNGFYPRWQHLASAITAPFPFALGEVFVLASAALALTHLVRRMRKREFLDAAFDLLVIASLFVVWFEVSWGLNYERAPIETRVVVDTQHVDATALAALRARAIAQMNELAPLAHARADETLNLAALRAAWLPVAARFGDDWTPHVGAPKLSLTEPFMVATGTQGFIDPFSLEVQLAPDALWFERPFLLAHEWTHVAAFAREDEANYSAMLTCLRSQDPVVRYSGWLELFTYLPAGKYTNSTFVPLVWSDFAAIRERNKRHVNLTLSWWSWHAYNVYLKSNHVAAGVANYAHVVQLLLSIPLDRAGLPTAR